MSKQIKFYGCDFEQHKLIETLERLGVINKNEYHYYLDVFKHTTIAQVGEKASGQMDLEKLLGGI